MTKASLNLVVFAVDGWVRVALTGRLLQALLHESRRVTLSFLEGYRPVSYARNHAVNQFLRSEAEWLIMIDHDTVPPPHFLGIVPMMERNGKFIAELPYPLMPGLNQVYPRPFFSVGWFEASGRLRAATDLPAGWSTGYDWLGAGALVVHRSVFEKVPRPYFKMASNEPGVREADTEGLPDSAAEDLYFTRKAKLAGFKLWTHSEFVCDHYKTIPLLSVMEIVHAAEQAGADARLAQSNPALVLPGSKCPSS